MTAGLLLVFICLLPLCHNYYSNNSQVLLLDQEFLLGLEVP